MISLPPGIYFQSYIPDINLITLSTVNEKPSDDSSSFHAKCSLKCNQSTINQQVGVYYKEDISIVLLSVSHSLSNKNSTQNNQNEHTTSHVLVSQVVGMLFHLSVL